MNNHVREDKVLKYIGYNFSRDFLASVVLICLTLSDPPFEANRFKIAGGCARRTSLN